MQNNVILPVLGLALILCVKEEACRMLQHQNCLQLSCTPVSRQTAQDGRC